MSETTQAIETSYLLRIDRVGSFQIVTGPRVMLGGPQSGAAPETIQILGPLSRQHAEIRRGGNGYRIEPVRGAVRLAADSIAETQHQGSLLAGETQCRLKTAYELAGGIQCRLTVPSPLCHSARLQIDPVDRLRKPVDGIVLMDRLLVLGPGVQSHICCRHWSRSGVLVYQQGEFLFRSPIGLEGAGDGEKIDLQLPQRRYVHIDEIGFYLEPLSE